MPIIDRLGVELFADVTKFVRGIDKSTSQISRFTRDMQKSIGRLKAFGSALIAFAAGSRFVRGFAEIAGEMDNLAKTARKLGIAPEALGKLRSAAKKSGVEIKALDTGIQRFIRRTAEAAGGKGEALGAFAELGLDPAELKGLSPEKALQRVADAFSKIDNQADKVRLAFKLFDTEGVALVNLLNEGADGMQALFDAAERNGGLFTAEQLAGVEAMNESFQDVAESAKGFTASLVAAAAPTLKFMADEVARMLQGLNGSLSTTEALAIAFASVADVIREFLLLLFRAVSEIAKATITLIEFLGGNAEAAKAARDQIDKDFADINEAPTFVERVKDFFKQQKRDAEEGQPFAGVGGGGLRQPGAKTFGTVAAANRLAAASDPRLKVAQDHFAEHKKTNGFLADIERNTREQGIPVALIG